jgi:hypothetical protein
MLNRHTGLFVFFLLCFLERRATMNNFFYLVG